MANMKPKPSGWDTWPDFRKEQYDPARYLYEREHPDGTNKPQTGLDPKRGPDTSTDTNSSRGADPSEKPGASNGKRGPDPSAGFTDNGPRGNTETADRGTVKGHNTGTASQDGGTTNLDVKIPQKQLDDWKAYLNPNDNVDPFSGSMTAEDILRGYPNPLGDENFRVPGTADQSKFQGIPYKPVQDQTLMDMRRYWLDQNLKGNAAGIRTFQKQLIDAGLLDPTDQSSTGYQPGKILSINDPTLVAANRLWSMSIEQKKNVHDLLSELDTTNGPVAAKGKTSTKTTNAVSLSNASDITDTTTTLFQRLMGRDPQPGEIQSLLGGLNAAEKANPVSTTTTDTTTIDNNANPTTQESQSSSGGVNATGNLTNQIKGDYSGEIQTHGANAFMGSLLNIIGM